jgi:hypothetical protein
LTLDKDKAMTVYCAGKQRRQWVAGEMDEVMNTTADQAMIR